MLHHWRNATGSDIPTAARLASLADHIVDSIPVLIGREVRGLQVKCLNGKCLLLRIDSVSIVLHSRNEKRRRCVHSDSMLANKESACCLLRQEPKTPGCIARHAFSSLVVEILCVNRVGILVSTDLLPTIRYNGLFQPSMRLHLLDARP